MNLLPIGINSQYSQVIEAEVHYGIEGRRGIVVLRGRGALWYWGAEVHCGIEEQRCIMVLRGRGALWYWGAEVHCGIEGQRCIVVLRGRGALWYWGAEVHCGIEGQRCIVVLRGRGALWYWEADVLCCCGCVAVLLYANGNPPPPLTSATRQARPNWMSLMFYQLQSFSTPSVSVKDFKKALCLRLMAMRGVPAGERTGRGNQCSCLCCGGKGHG